MEALNMKLIKQTFYCQMPSYDYAMKIFIRNILFHMEYILIHFLQGPWRCSWHEKLMVLACTWRPLRLFRPPPSMVCLPSKRRRLVRRRANTNHPKLIVDQLFWGPLWWQKSINTYWFLGESDTLLFFSFWIGICIFKDVFIQIPREIIWVVSSNIF